MSHNLNEGRIFYFGEKPWHGIGTRLDNPATAIEAIAAARLGYEVEKRPIFLENGSKIEGQQATVRTDTEQVLGIVGDRYKVVQNTEAFDFFDSVVGRKDAIYHTAGALGKGERIWILAKLPNDIIVFHDDVVEKYLVLVTTHDGKSSLKMYYTPIRVVCNNTLTASLHNTAHEINIRHSGSIHDKLQIAKETLGFALKFYDEFGDVARHLVSIKLNVKQVGDYFDALIFGSGKNAEKNRESTRLNTIKDTLIHLYDNGKGNSREGVKHSAWTAYNAVTEYVGHMRTVRGVQNNPAKRMESIILGTGAQLSAQAFSLARTL